MSSSGVDLLGRPLSGVVLPAVFSADLDVAHAGRCPEGWFLRL